MHNEKQFLLRKERHITDVAPTELVIFCGRMLYKDVAPLALEMAGRVSPLRAGRPDQRRRARSDAPYHLTSLRPWRAFHGFAAPEGLLTCRSR